jgi:hypothetical protein
VVSIVYESYIFADVTRKTDTSRENNRLLLYKQGRRKYTVWTSGQRPSEGKDFKNFKETKF